MFTAGLLLLLLLPPNIILIFQPAAHGTDISTGNQPGIPSLPAATPDAGSTSSPSPGERASYQENSNQYWLGMPGGHDRNHIMAGLCARAVNKAGDGTESSYCSSEFVVGQSRYFSFNRNSSPRKILCFP